MRTLLVIDVQNDFCTGGALEVKNGEEIVPLINEARSVFDRVIFTQDWHPIDHKSFATNHQGMRVGEVIELMGVQQILWPVHCVQNTRGAMFHPELIIHGDDKVFKKGTNPDIDSYSAFYDNSRKSSTGLTQYLKELKITDITFCGLATDYCVKFSVLDALQDGFRVSLWLSACRGVELNKGDIERSINEMKKEGVKVIQSPNSRHHS